MFKKIATILSTLTLLLGSAPVLAAPNLSNSSLETSGAQRTLILPPAADNAPVISLGSAVDPQTGKVVEGYAIIHYKKNFTHKSNHKPGNPSGSSCYTYIGSNTKWKVIEPWIVNPSNTRGLTDNFVLTNLGDDIAKWEDAADGNVGNAQSVDILGSGSATSSALVADTSSPDGQNEVYFADVSSSGAIAVTIVWGYFSGPPFARELVEWDQVYDDIDFDWSSTGEAGKMDFENIATHELGHSFGMGDVYDLACIDVTMFGYADYGETNKRTLESADVTGIDRLY